MNVSPEVPKVQREPVLILLHSDGYVEVYGPNHVDVVTRIVPKMETPKGEILAEEWVEKSLPIRYRKLYGANCLRATAMLREVAPSDIAQVKAIRELFRALESINAMVRSAVAS